MNTCRILFDSFADKGLVNAQMTNAREIVRRLDPERFHVSMFHVSDADDAIASRPNTTLIRLPKRRQTPWILRQFISGPHDIAFYLKPSPATKWYLKFRRRLADQRITAGTIESRSDLRKQSAIDPKAADLWEQTVLRADKLFSNSRAVQRNLQHEYGLESEVVPTGVDTKFFTPETPRSNKQRPRVLFVGALRPLKQPEIVLEAAARFPQAHFVVVGEGPLSATLQQRIERDRLANVEIIGTLAGESLRREYRAADIFLFPSSWEGSPKVILEAAASGLPVIARKDYEPETVVDGSTGFLVRSDEELFIRLGTLLRSYDLRQRFGSAGRRHSTNFEWDNIARQWQEVFLELWARMRSIREP
jgi:glycosyltransferase involved in cell wall biosynthesis